jgi:N-acetylglucosamine-6-sulfatase
VNNRHAPLTSRGPATAALNVVVIETDDQRADDVVAMPRTSSLIGAQGIEFVNSFVSHAECCPSRATFLTGQYAHNHGVRSTVPPFGGLKRLDGSETLAVWLRRAGYTTGMVGKYLNGYRGRSVPPGWTDFEGLLGRFTYRFYGYTLNANGTLESPSGYQTDDITERSLAFIRTSSEPFFLWVNYVAPHVGRPHDLSDPRVVSSTVPALRHAGAFLGAPLPRTPSFDEADVSDKPPAIRRRMPLKQWRIAAPAEAHRQRLASLLAVDEGVGRIVDALRATGELDDTLLIFTSDNGSTARRCCAPSPTTARSCSTARPCVAPTGYRCSRASAPSASSTSSTSGARPSSTTCGATRTSSRTSPGHTR